MSWQAIAWSFAQTFTTTPAQTLLLQYLCNRHNYDTDEAFCSIRTIQTDCNIRARSTVCKVLNQLEEKGVITRIKTDHRKCNTFKIHWADVTIRNPNRPPPSPPPSPPAHTEDPAHAEDEGSDLRTSGDTEGPIYGLEGSDLRTSEGPRNGPPSESYIESKDNHQDAHARAREASAVQEENSSVELETGSRRKRYEYPPDFQMWWKAWVKVTGKDRAKKRAYEQWKRLGDRRPRTDSLIADVETRETQDKRWLRGFIPDPERYLKDRRWDDGLEDGKRGQAQKVVSIHRGRQPGPKDPFADYRDD